MKWVIFSFLAAALVAAAVAVIGLLLPKAHTATRTARLRFPPEAVWKLVAGDQRWRPSLKACEELPSVNGRRSWREVDRSGQAIAFETVEGVEPRRLVTSIADPTLPFGGSWTYEIEPEPQGSFITITEHGEVYNPIFRFMSRFVFGHTATMDRYLKELETKLSEGGQARGTGA